MTTWQSRRGVAVGPCVWRWVTEVAACRREVEKVGEGFLPVENDTGSGAEGSTLASSRGERSDACVEVGKGKW